MITTAIGLINGLVFGIEHLSEKSDTDIAWIIAINLIFIRVLILKYRE